MTKYHEQPGGRFMVAMHIGCLVGLVVIIVAVVLR